MIRFFTWCFTWNNAKKRPLFWPIYRHQESLNTLKRP
jgi:hypothetical protein